MSPILRVLLVEDNQADVDLIRELLPETGPASFEIEPVPRLADALARLKSGPIDIVLLDLGLPDSQGLDTFVTLHRAAPGIPIIVLTGNKDQETAVTAVREGAQDYLVKGQVSANMLAQAARYAMERKRATAELQERATLLNALVNSAGDTLIFSLDGNLRYTAFNEEHRKMMQRVWNAEIALGTRLPDFMTDPDLRAREEGSMRRALEGESFTETLHQPQTDVWFEMSWNPVRRDDGAITGLTTYIRDVTKRKRMEELLAETSRRLEMALRLSGAGTWDWDIVTGRISWSASMFELFGLDPRSTASSFESWRGALHPEDRDIAEIRIQKALEEHTPLDSDYRVILPDGRIRWINASGTGVYDAQGRPVSMLGICLDITERRKTDEALRSAHDRLRRLIDANIVGILVGTPSGTIIEANDYYLNLIGFTREELERGLVDWRTITPPEWLHADEVAIRELRERGFCTPYEKEYLRRDGTRVPVYLSDTMLPGPGEQIVAFAIDITERKQAENELRALSARQEAILDAVHDVIMEVDANKVYNWANPAGLEFFGEDVVGKEASFYFEGEQNTYQAVQPLFNGKDGMLYVESWQRRRDGRKRLLGWWCRTLRDDQGRVTGALSSARDITEWHEAEVALIESERKFRSLFASMQEGVALHEVIRDASGKAVDYRLLDVNPAFEKHTALPLKRARGALASELYGGVAPPYLEEYARVAEGGDPISFETRFPGLEKHFSVSVVSPRKGQFATVFEDITDKKRQQEELRLKSAEMERFTYTVSHDLKAPLVTIKTFVGYLEEDQLKGNSGRVEKDMFYLRSAADKMAELLDELLEMSRIGRIANPPLRVTFKELVEEARTAVAGRIAERGVEITVADAAVTLFGDRPRLAQVWQNLIENAAKFMGDQVAPLIEVGVETAGGKTVFFVRDNGMGIDPVNQGKVFNLFERLDPRIEGTGLGLALVTRIVELYGGTIGVDSKGAGSGSTFRFTLPKAIPTRQDDETS